MFSPEKKYQVYTPQERYSDMQNPLDCGRDFDPTQSFFQQFDALLHTVPQIALLGVNNENSEYNNFGGYSKNAYLSFDY